MKRKNVNLLINYAENIRNDLLMYIRTDLGFQIDKDELFKECEIFTLWIMSILMRDNKNKDIFHSQYYFNKGLNESQILDRFQEQQIRYNNYTYGYNSWVRTKDGLSLGGIMEEILIKQNPNFKAEDTIPMADALTAHQLFTFFGKTFKSLIDVIGPLKI